MRINSIAAAPYKNNSYKKISFKGVEEDVKNLEDEIRELEVGYESCSTISDRLFTTARISRKQAELFDKYKILDKILANSSIINYDEDEKALSEFMSKMNSLSSDKGFNRIYGYSDIKDKLIESFILDTIAKEKTSQGANVPNAILFYGPTGCGKTSFAKALGEQSLTNVKIINASAETENNKEILKRIIDCAEQSKKDYAESKDKTRTIIVINEFEYIAYPESDIIEELKEVIKDCSNKYKCTFFLTSNNPQDIDESFLSKDITPCKVALGFADKETAREIIEGYQKDTKSPIFNIDAIIDELFSKNGFYSNAQIIETIKKVDGNSINPAKEDYIREFQQTRPIITNKDIEKFENDKKALLG